MLVWCRALAVLGVLAGVFSGASPSFAAHARFRIFESASFSQPGSFSNPTGVAVDQETGNVYVADSASDVVDVFGAEGGSPADGVSAQITGLELNSSEPAEVAVDNACLYHVPRLVGVACESFDASNGDVYVAEEGDNAVVKYKLNALSDEYELVGTLAVAGSPNGVAVDTQGSVYVAAYGEEGISEFNPSGIETGKISQDIVRHPAYIAVDAPGVVYVGNYEGGVAKLQVNSKGEVEHETELDDKGKAVAVDSHGNVYVDSGASITEYNASGDLSEEFGSGSFEGSSGVAVNDETEDTYVSNRSGENIDVFGPAVVVPDVATGPASGEESKATFTGTVDPDGLPVTSCEFEYGTNTEYGSTAPCSQKGIGSGTSAKEVSAEVGGLEPRTIYHFRLVAANANGVNRSSDATVTVGSPPLVEGDGSVAEADGSVVDVSSSGATLQARIDPGGLQTSYRFEYGTTEAYGASLPLPEGELEPSLTVEPVSVQPRGLQANTTYHFRVVAVNRLGTTPGADHTFTTLRTGGTLTLPDGRAWEMVSPPEKYDGFIRPLFAEGVAQASSEGNVFSFIGEPSLLPKAQGSSIFDQVLARRKSAGWSDEDIATPHDAPPGSGVGEGQEYRLFSPDLSLALVQPYGSFTGLSPEATERTPYIRDNDDPTCEVESLEKTCFQPLVTAANVPLGTKFGGDPTSGSGAVEVVGSTPDLSHVLLRVSEPGVALTSTSAVDGLYEWSAGRLQLVSLLPQAVGGGPIAGYLGHDDEETPHAISDDGSRVVWGGGPGTEHLYLRDTVKEQTIELDAVQPGGSGEGNAAAQFQIASADGTKVFFTDEQQLTKGSGAVGSDLYECEVVETSGALTCRLKDLTTAITAGGSAEVPSVAVLGSSENASYVYFLARGVLATNANEATDEKAVAGANNLYVLHDTGTEWATSFIAALSGEDEFGLKRTLTARVSPSGRYLAFMSNQSLTGYDNLDAVSGVPDEEVYLYDAEGKPHLICASCLPSGARPAGTFEPTIAASLPPLELVDGPGIWEGSWLAANIPTYENFRNGEFRYQPRFLSDSGRLFFNDADALVPQDVNGQWDVYQFEPAGVGTCTGESETFDHQTGGCVNLISSGRSSQESAFLGASETGGDAFFVTSEGLSRQDTDEQVDVYDAHECTGASPCVAMPTVASASPCTTGEACRPGASSQPAIFGAPPSATFSGAGNVTKLPAVTKPKSLTRSQKLAKALKACRTKRNKRKRRICEAQGHKRYGPTARKAGDKRRSRS